MSEANLELERQRLAKLLTAYEAQERELVEVKNRISMLEKTLVEKEDLVDTLKGVVDDRDKDIRDLDISLASMKKEHSRCEPKLNEMDEDVKKANERFTKLYSIAEEMEAELKEVRTRLESRDRWFNNNIDVIKMMVRAIEDREDMIKPMGEMPSVKEVQTIGGK